MIVPLFHVKKNEQKKKQNFLSFFRQNYCECLFQTDVFIATLFTVVWRDSSLFVQWACMCDFTFYTGLHLLFRKKQTKKTTDTWHEYFSVWMRKVVFQREQYVHISIPVQVAMFDFSSCAIIIERNPLKNSSILISVCLVSSRSFL